MRSKSVQDILVGERKANVTATYYQLKSPVVSFVAHKGSNGIHVACRNSSKEPIKTLLKQSKAQIVEKPFKVVFKIGSVTDEPFTNPNASNIEQSMLSQFPTRHQEGSSRAAEPHQINGPTYRQESQFMTNRFAVLQHDCLLDDPTLQSQADRVTLCLSHSEDDLNSPSRSFTK